MSGMNKYEMFDAIYQLKHEDEEYHVCMIVRVIHEYDDYSASYEGDGTDSIDSEEFKILLTENYLGIFHD